MIPPLPQYEVNDFQREVRNLIWENLPTDKNRMIAMMLYFDYSYDILDFSYLGDGEDFKFSLSYERTTGRISKDGKITFITGKKEMKYN